MSLSLLRRFLSCVLVVLIGIPAILSAETHLVSSVELQKELMVANAVRERNTENITGFLSSSPKAQKALAAAGVDGTQGKSAVSLLSDQELARLAGRAQAAHT